MLVVAVLTHVVLDVIVRHPLITLTALLMRVLQTPLAQALVVYVGVLLR
jgi:hypothetical protein